MNSKCAKNKYSFKTLEKVNVASNQGVWGPVEYNGHIFKTVLRHQNTVFWLDETNFNEKIKT